MARKAKCYHCGKKQDEADMYEMLMKENLKSVRLCHKCYKKITEIVKTYHDSY
jgi:NAD-dependent SIR2 family protein deacetylase